MSGSLFPQWVNRVRPLASVVLVLVPVYLVGVLYYGGSPTTTDVGYMPQQPVPFSHAMHAGQLGIDCRYCHTTVEKAAFAALPPTSVCMNCHERIAPKSPKLLLVQESYATGKPIPWVKVHDLPDYVYFNHSAHVTRGVSCVSCHGRIDTMDQVRQVKKLSMSWCLECHRNPDAELRPVEAVTNLSWTPEKDPAVLGREIRTKNNINPSTDCSTCHR